MLVQIDPQHQKARRLAGCAHIVIAIQPDGTLHLQAFRRGGFNASYADKQGSVLAQIPALLAELRNELAADDAKSSAGEPLMSVPAAVVIADEIDFWSNSGGQVTIDPNCREVVDLVGQPAVAPVPHPDSESAILACGNV